MFVWRVLHIGGDIERKGLVRPMINGQSRPADMPIMADVSGHDDECLRFIERTSQTNPRRQSLSNLW